MFNRAARVSVSLLLLFGVGCLPDSADPPSSDVPPPATTPTPPTTTTTAPIAQEPSPALAPEQVVRLVTEALGANDAPSPDAGIATAFGFASPGNRQVTGPLERFIPMVKTPAYLPLLTYAQIEYAPIRVEGNFAEQVVTVTDDAGHAAAFLWILSRQKEGDYEDCWMTDGVSRLGADPIPPDPNQRREQETPEIRV